MISGLHGLTYEEKLKELKITSLNDRRIRADMIQTFKILNGIDSVDKDQWFTTVSSTNRTINTRLGDDPLNLVRTRVSKLDIRQNFFSQRVINEWNGLPTELKTCQTVSSFKTKYDAFKGTTGGAEQTLH